MITSETRMLVHVVCKSQLISVGGGPVFCDVCNHAVQPDEIMEVDNSPSPFSG